MTNKDFSKMLQHCNDVDLELRDVLVMLAQTVEAQDAQIKRLEAQMKSVNQMYPSTAEMSHDEWRARNSENRDE